MIKKIGEYQLKEEIGFGSFSRVYYSENSQGDQYAIKMINKENLSQISLEGIEKEIEILLKLNHPNIIRLHDIKKTGNNWYLVFDYCKYGDLGKFMKTYMKQGIPEIVVQKIIQQLSKSMQELRKFNIVHRDMKLGNVLLEKGFDIKLADFGFARFQGEQEIMMSFCGTPITMAPEVLKRQNYNEKCDIWSLGIIIYQLLFGKPPFMPTMKNSNVSDALLQAIESQKINYKTLNIQSQSCKDLLKKMLVMDPVKRISFDELFQHPWILEQQPESSQQQISELFDQIMETIQKKEQKILDPKQSIIINDDETQENNLNKNYIKQLEPAYINNFIATKSFELIYSNTDQYLNQMIKKLVFQIDIDQQIINNDEITKKYIPKLMFLSYMCIQGQLTHLYKNDVQIYFGQKRILDLPLPETIKAQIATQIHKINQLQQKITKNYNIKIEDLVKSESYSTLTALSKYVLLFSNKIVQDEYENCQKSQDLLELHKFLKNICIIIEYGQYLQDINIIIHNNDNNQILKEKFLQESEEEKIKKIYIQQKELKEEQIQLATIEKMEIVKVQYQQKSHINKNTFNQQTKKVFLNENLSLMLTIFNDKIEYYEEILQQKLQNKN